MSLFSMEMFRAPALASVWRIVVVATALGIAATAQAQGGPADSETDADPDVFAAQAPLPGAPQRPTIGSIPTRMSEMFFTGGPVMWPIAICSIVAVAFGIERLVVLRRRRVIPKDFVTRFIAHLEEGSLDRAGALKLCEENGSPVAEVFAHGIRKWAKPSVEVEQAIIDGGERQVSQLRKNLRALNAVATVTPLLGLLGTVFGMIDCFNRIAGSSAMGKSEQLAGGIGMALISTAAGLSIAIPALMLYMYLAGRVDALVVEMDLLAQKVVNLISAESLSSQTLGMPRISQRPKTVGTAAVKNP
jgi:biopolymer transport protein ExbB